MFKTNLRLRLTSGLAADITLETQSEESMLITDVIKNLGKAFKKIQN
ncbi:MAG: hypothetical protein ACOYLP_00570 [Flavobacterium sp.]